MSFVEWNNYFGNLCVIHHQFYSLFLCVCLCDEFHTFISIALFFLLYPFLGSFWCFSLRLFFCLSCVCVFGAIRNLFHVSTYSKIPKIVCYVFFICTISYTLDTNLIGGIFMSFVWMFVLSTQKYQMDAHTNYHVMAIVTQHLMRYNNNNSTLQSNGKLFTSTLIDFYLLTVFLSFFTHSKITGILDSDSIFYFLPSITVPFRSGRYEHTLNQFWYFISVLSKPTHLSYNEKWSGKVTKKIPTDSHLKSL